MSEEFDIEQFLFENLPNKKDKPVNIKILSRHALFLGDFLIARIEERERSFKKGEVGEADRSVELEDSIAILCDKFKGVGGVDNLVDVQISLTQRERDDLGNELIRCKNSLGVPKPNKAYGGPVIDAYIAADKAYVTSGGIPNSVLRNQVKGLR